MLLCGVLLAAFAPAERVLGNLLGLIYLHIGFVLGALVLFALAAGSALLAATSGSVRAREVARESMALGLFSWVVYVALSMAVAWLAWGGVNWQEPRLVNAFRVIVWIAVAEGGRLVTRGRWDDVVSALEGAGAVAIWSRRGTMLHPLAPIRSSDSSSVKAYAVGVVASILASLALLLAARLVARSDARRLP